MHTFKAKAPYIGTVDSVHKLVKPGASGEVSKRSCFVKYAHSTINP